MNDLSTQREKLNRAVPVAIENLMALALQTSNGKLRLEASREILDRHGHFSKVSRIGVPTEDQGGIGDSIDNEVATNLIGSLLNARAAATSSSQTTTTLTPETPTPTEKIQ